MAVLNIKLAALLLFNDRFNYWTYLVDRVQEGRCTSSVFCHPRPADNAKHPCRQDSTVSGDAATLFHVVSDTLTTHTRGGLQRPKTQYLAEALFSVQDGVKQIPKSGTWSKNITKQTLPMLHNYSFLVHSLIETAVCGRIFLGKEWTMVAGGTAIVRWFWWSVSMQSREPYAGETFLEWRPSRCQ